MWHDEKKRERKKEKMTRTIRRAVGTRMHVKLHKATMNKRDNDGANRTDASNKKKKKKGQRKPHMLLAKYRT